MFAPKRKDALFFDALSAQAALNRRAAEVLQSMFARMRPAAEVAVHPFRADCKPDLVDEQTVALAKSIAAMERDGDRLKHESMKRLRENWITPLDREDIRGLVQGLDDVLDRIDSVAERITLFELCFSPPDALELASILVASSTALAAAIEPLRSVKGKKTSDILEYCADVNRLETAADAVLRRAMADLFATGNDPLVVMKWRDVYDGLESATDSCEDVADVIEGIVLEYA